MAHVNKSRGTYQRWKVKGAFLQSNRGTCQSKRGTFTLRKGHFLPIKRDTFWCKKRHFLSTWKSWGRHCAPPPSASSLWEYLTYPLLTIQMLIFLVQWWYNPGTSAFQTQLVLSMATSIRLLLSAQTNLSACLGPRGMVLASRGKWWTRKENWRFDFPLSPLFF